MARITAKVLFTRWASSRSSTVFCSSAFAVADVEQHVDRANERA